MLLKALFVGEVQDSSIPTGDVTLDSYARIDLAVNWTLNPTFAILLAVENLFDADYEEFVGFPLLGSIMACGYVFRYSSHRSEHGGNRESAQTLWSTMALTQVSQGPTLGLRYAS